MIIQSTIEDLIMNSIMKMSCTMNAFEEKIALLNKKIVKYNGHS